MSFSGCLFSRQVFDRLQDGPAQAADICCPAGCCHSRRACSSSSSEHETPDLMSERPTGLSTDGYILSWKAFKSCKGRTFTELHCQVQFIMHPVEGDAVHGVTVGGHQGCKRCSGGSAMQHHKERRLSWEFLLDEETGVVVAKTFSLGWIIKLKQQEIISHVHARMCSIQHGMDPHSFQWSRSVSVYAEKDHHFETASGLLPRPVSHFLYGRLGWKMLFAPHGIF